MAELKDNLDALAASLPDLPGELEALRTLADRVERDVVDFLNEIGDRDGQVSSRLAELHASLEACSRQCVDERVQLESVGDVFDQRLEASLGELQSDGQRLTDAVEGARTAAGALKQTLDETSSAARGAELDAARALTELEGAAQSAKDGVRAAFDSMQEEADALRGAIEESGEGVQRATNDLLQRLRDVAEQAKDRIAQTAERLDGLRAAHEAGVPERRARVLEDHAAIVASLRERTESELRARVGACTETVVSALKALDDEGRQAAQACLDARGTLQAALEGLVESTLPLPQGIAAVKEAGAQVGLYWG
jgi:predicted  nucleic acid-binding Zn-ribbon protein